MRELDDAIKQPDEKDKPLSKLDKVMAILLLIETIAVAVLMLSIGVVLTKIGLMQRGRILDWYESALKVVDFSFRVIGAVAQTIFWAGAAVLRLFHLVVIWQWVWHHFLRLWLKKPWQRMIPQRKAV